MKIYRGLGEFAGAEGDDLGTSDWVVVDQARIDTFADATGDHQWIHVDPARAATGPFGGTIAHGLLTLALLPTLINGLYRVDDVTMAVNYGLDKVRFLTPVPAGSRIRATSRVARVERLEGAVQALFETTIELEGAAKPAAVVQSIVRYVA
ncbi:MaoC/PaaZ C-terminal domain-containing protein [Nocardioides zeae]|uniref:MaoC family dehydratase n=1 Tax=Nocardioides zeae TaxID=1457234 RepID=A0A6P0HH63_9ACTN|nr:MaoC family dehydratase [Nocardioides zeae]